MHLLKIYFLDNLGAEDEVRLTPYKDDKPKESEKNALIGNNGSTLLLMIGGDIMYFFDSEIKNDLSKEINIISFEKGTPDGHKYMIKHILDENEYFILYVTEGIAAFKHAEKNFKLKKNNFIIARAEDSLEFMFSQRNPCTYYKLNFYDNNFTSLVDKYNLVSGRNNCYDFNYVTSILSRLLRQYILLGNVPTLLLENLFLYLSLSTKQASITDKNIILLAEDINAKYRENIDVNLYAVKCSLSHERFSQIFNQTLGVGPHRYQLIKKINHAQYLLKHTDLAINEISSVLKFSSPLYFSNLFKKYTNQSPKQYRSKIRS